MKCGDQAGNNDRLPQQERPEHRSHSCKRARGVRHDRGAGLAGEFVDPDANPRRRGPTTSTFIKIVVDQHRPCCNPRSVIAAMTQPNDWANTSRSGNGIPNIQPATRTRFRPNRSARAPEAKLSGALARPKATMNDRATVLDPTGNRDSASSGTSVLVTPSEDPTNATCSTRSRKRGRFDRTPSIGRTPWCVAVETVSLVELIKLSFACSARTPNDSGVGGSETSFRMWFSNWSNQEA